MNENENPWKPNSYKKCPTCDGKMYISSIIPMNGQVNFACINDDCATDGFINKGIMYFNEIEPLTPAEPTETIETLIRQDIEWCNMVAGVNEDLLGRLPISVEPPTLTAMDDKEKDD